jgi:putative NADPH-quinone reductase
MLATCGGQAFYRQIAALNCHCDNTKENHQAGFHTMQISVILAHPDAHSFNHAIAQAAVAKLTQMEHQVVFHDLYAEKFDPILPANEIPKNARLPREIELHCREIAHADGIIIIHPNWWGQPPAILKGWIDRVIRPDVAYQFLEGDQGEGVPVGLLKARAALVFNTSNTSTQREAQVFGDPLETLWKNCVFGLCGVETVYRETFSVIVTSTLGQRKAWLEKVQEAVGQYLPKEKRAD